MLDPGDQAPDFRAEDQDQKQVSLGDLTSNGPFVLYFYPKDFTPGCTRQARSFRDASEELAALGARVVGVSADDPASHRAFARKHRLDFTLLADPGRVIARRYGAIHPFGLGTQRITYVIDREGIVRGAFHHELRIGKHLEQVQALLRHLSAA